MASIISLEFEDDAQYQFCVERFANYYNFAGSEKELIIFMQQKLIDFIYAAVEANVIHTKREIAVEEAKTDTATNLDITKIRIVEQPEKLVR